MYKSLLISRISPILIFSWNDSFIPYIWFIEEIFMIRKFFYPVLGFLIFTFFLSLMYYYSCFSKEVFLLFRILGVLFFFLLEGYFLEKRSRRKYQYDFFFLILFLTVSLLYLFFSHQFHFSILIYYSILFSSLFLGGAICHIKKRN